MGYLANCFKNRQMIVNLFYTSLVLFSGKGFSREVKRRIKLNDLTVTQLTSDSKVTSVHSKVADFFNTQNNQKIVRDLKLELQQNQIKREQEKSWNTASFSQITNPDNGNDEKLVVKKIEKIVVSPFEMEFKVETKKMFAKKKEDSKLNSPSGYLIKSSRHQLTENTQEESTPLNVKLKVRPEQAKAKVIVEKGNLKLEADYKLGANGKREIASVHTLSSLGVTTKLAYNLMNQQVITSVDKRITDTISTRLTQTTGFKTDRKAEVIYSLSF